MKIQELFESRGVDIDVEQDDLGFTVTAHTSKNLVDKTVRTVKAINKEIKKFGDYKFSDGELVSKGQDENGDFVIVWFHR